MKSFKSFTQYLSNLDNLSVGEEFYVISFYSYGCYRVKIRKFVYTGDKKTHNSDGFNLYFKYGSHYFDIDLLVKFGKYHTWFDNFTNTNFLIPKKIVDIVLKNYSINNSYIMVIMLLYIYKPFK